VVRKREQCFSLWQVERFLTQLFSDEPQAEAECVRVLEEALSYDDSDWEALQSLASVRISQSDKNSASELMLRSYESWKEADLDEKPSYESRISSSKLFLELELWDTAADILQDLIEEDDNVAEVWYLLAFALFNNQDPHGAVECGQRARHVRAVL
jgi:tetratricopeptide (TPR) repeat protein